MNPEESVPPPGMASPSSVPEPADASRPTPVTPASPNPRTPWLIAAAAVLVAVVVVVILVSGGGQTELQKCQSQFSSDLVALRSAVNRTPIETKLAACLKAGYQPTAIQLTTLGSFAGAGNQSTNSESDLKNAQTVVESEADTDNAMYPAESSAVPLSRAFPADSDAQPLAAVTYQAPGGSTDTFVLALGTYWLESVNGTTYYGVGTAPAAGSVPAGASTQGWPG